MIVATRRLEDLLEARVADLIEPLPAEASCTRVNQAESAVTARSLLSLSVSKG